MKKRTSLSPPSARSELGALLTSCALSATSGGILQRTRLKWIAFRRGVARLRVDELMIRLEGTFSFFIRLPTRG